MRKGWTYKKLGEVTTTINGLWTGKKPPFINVAVVRNTNFTKDCKLDMTNVAYLDVELKQYNSRKLLPGDIIIEKSGGSDKQPVGRPVLFDIPEGEYSFSNFTSTLRINNADEIIPQFLHCALYSAYLRGETFKLQSKTTGIHNLDFKGYNRLPIPIPSLSEQQSIVAELDKINELINLKKAQLSDLDNLAQSIFYDMFGDPIENEKGWEVKKLGELCEIVRGGSPRPINNYLGGDIPWIKIGDATTGDDIYLHSTKEYIIKEGLKKTRYIPTGSLIFANCGVSLGFARIITFKGCIHDGWLAMMNIKEEKLGKIFLLKSLNFCTQYFRNNAPEGTQPNLNTNIMKVFKQILPPLSLQQDFAKRIELIEQQKAQISSTIKDLETLLELRMQYWFD